MVTKSICEKYGDPMYKTNDGYVFYLNPCDSSDKFLKFNIYLGESIESSIMYIVETKGWTREYTYCEFEEDFRSGEFPYSEEFTTIGEDSSGFPLSINPEKVYTKEFLDNIRHVSVFSRFVPIINTSQEDLDYIVKDGLCEILLNY